MFHIPKKESTVYILGAHLVFDLYQRPCRFSTWINGFGFNVQFKVKIVSGGVVLVLRSRGNGWKGPEF